MQKKYRYFLLVLIPIGLVALLLGLTHGSTVDVLQPAGVIGHKERSLIFFALGLSLLVVIPVFVMTFAIAWKYREGNTKAKYSPDFDHSRLLETIWWLIPTALILVLSVVTWRSSHDLDPFRPLNSSIKPITVQVVSLDWKWLFIYPDQSIATVNYLQVPTNTPINFQLTSDGPMNSFWVPQLAGQIYTMPGMSTQLHLMASKTGSYYGSSANISGAGFADMHFTVQATSQADFDTWVQARKRTPNMLSQDVYNQLAKPSRNTATAYYSPVKSDLYGTILLKFMGPGGHMQGMQAGTDGMGM